MGAPTELLTCTRRDAKEGDSERHGEPRAPRISDPTANKHFMVWGLKGISGFASGQASLTRASSPHNSTPFLFLGTPICTRKPRSTPLPARTSLLQASNHAVEACAGLSSCLSRRLKVLYGGISLISKPPNVGTYGSHVPRHLL